jgi:hypothetical protein
MADEPEDAELRELSSALWGSAWPNGKPAGSRCLDVADYMVEHGAGSVTDIRASMAALIGLGKLRLEKPAPPVGPFFELRAKLWIGDVDVTEYKQGLAYADACLAFDEFAELVKKFMQAMQARCVFSAAVFFLQLRVVAETARSPLQARGDTSWDAERAGALLKNAKLIGLKLGLRGKFTGEQLRLELSAMMFSWDEGAKADLCDSGSRLEELAKAAGLQILSEDVIEEVAKYLLELGE